MGAVHANVLRVSGKALSRLDKLMDSDNERIQLAAASEVMRHLPNVKIGPSTVQVIKNQRRADAARAAEPDLRTTLRRIAEFYNLDPDLVVGPAEADRSRLNDAETGNSVA